MPALNFKQLFVDAIRTGRKRQTIRKVRQRRPIQVNDTLYLYSGMRTRACQKIGAYRCVQILPIEITAHAITLDGADMLHWETDQLAHADGFASVKQLTDFFAAEYGLPFQGVVIEWEYDETTLFVR